MLDDLPALAAIVTAGILEEIPGLEAPEVAGLVDTMSQANGAMVLDGMVRDVSVDEIEVTADFVRGTQALADYRIPLASLLRGLPRRSCPLVAHLDGAGWAPRRRGGCDGSGRRRIARPVRVG